MICVPSVNNAIGTIVRNPTTKEVLVMMVGVTFFLVRCLARTAENMLTIR